MCGTVRRRPPARLRLDLEDDDDEVDLPAFNIEDHLARVRSCLSNEVTVVVDEPLELHKQSVIHPRKVTFITPPPTPPPFESPRLPSQSSSPASTARYKPANTHPVLAPSAFIMLQPPTPPPAAVFEPEDKTRAPSRAPQIARPLSPIKQRKRGAVKAACSELDGPTNRKRTVSAKLRWEDGRDTWF